MGHSDTYPYPYTWEAEADQMMSSSETLSPKEKRGQKKKNLGYIGQEFFKATE